MKTAYYGTGIEGRQLSLFEKVTQVTITSEDEEIYEIASDLPFDVIRIPDEMNEDRMTYFIEAE